MQAIGNPFTVTVVDVNHDSGRVDVRTRDGREFGIDAKYAPHAHKLYPVGAKVKVQRAVNSPYVYLQGTI
jgi:hypothetical protein